MERKRNEDVTFVAETTYPDLLVFSPVNPAPRSGAPNKKRWCAI